MDSFLDRPTFYHWENPPDGTVKVVAAQDFKLYADAMEDALTAAQAECDAVKARVVELTSLLNNERLMDGNTLRVRIAKLERERDSAHTALAAANAECERLRPKQRFIGRDLSEILYSEERAITEAERLRAENAELRKQNEFILSRFPQDGDLGMIITTTGNKKP